MKISNLVKLVHIENNTLNLLAKKSLTDADVMRALLQAWRNMPHQIHFEHLVVSEADAQKLHENARCYEELNRVSRVIWDHARFVSREEYESRIPELPGGRHRSVTLVKLAGPGGETSYAVQKPRDLGMVRDFAAAQILENEGIGPSGAFYEYQITFRNAKIFDFLRVGMFWRFHVLGALCPRCLCVESQVELEAKRDFVTHSQDARNLTETIIATSINQCSACDAKWEQTAYRWYSDFTY